MIDIIELDDYKRDREKYLLKENRLEGAISLQYKLSQCGRIMGYIITVGGKGFLVSRGFLRDISQECL
jgi:hypothetical protein